MKVLEVLNTPPGETFIRQHALAINQYAPDIKLLWAFSQTPSSGKLSGFDFEQTSGYAWPNYNQYPKWKQLLVKTRYLWDSEKALNTPQQKLLAKLKPDHVHFHFSTLAVKYAHLCIQQQIPYTFSVRGSDLHALSATTDADYIQRLRNICQSASGVHAVSKALKQQLESLTAYNQTEVIYTTIADSWNTINRQPESGLLVAAGRLTWQKGFPDLVIAIQQLRLASIPVKLVVIGEGPQRKELEFMIRELGLQSAITLTGNQTQEQIRQWFGKAYGFVLSSIAEGFPNVIAEAMAAGIPIVTSDCGGIPELIRDEKNARMYQAGNTEQLSERLKEVLNTNDHSSITDQAKKDALQFFSQQTHASAFRKLWNV
jgi:colanic acid/amylovoran biosynthesis glycosyltransferase